MIPSLAQRAAFALAASVAFGIASGPAAAAEAFPTRTVKLIVGFAPGGSSDTVARILGPKMAEVLKQTVLIDNRPGGGGNIATDALVKSPADGYTIMLGTIGSLAVNSHISKMSLNPATDTAPLSMAVTFTNILVVKSTSPIKSLAEYVQAAKAPDTTMFFGSSGIGSAGHLAGELLKTTAGLSSQHVAYRGGAPATNDLMGGSLASMFASPTDVLQFIETGKLRALATTGAKRLDALPNVPTVAESGYPGFEAANWYAFVAPKQTPPDVVKTLNAAIVAALTDPSAVAQLKKLGLDAAPSTPEATGAYLRREDEKWAAVVKQTGLKAE